ncbi:hypothetical protein GQX74_011180 [Glossina fuscipes]|nr:hypothetical protein GQX74_011180 [Glossina fuscipes]
MNNLVFITVAGRSNGLGPVLSGNTTYPAVNCPPSKAEDVQIENKFTLNLDIVITYHNCQTYVPVGMTEYFSLMNLILRVSRLTVQLPVIADCSLRKGLEIIALKMFVRNLE